MMRWLFYTLFLASLMLTLIQLSPTRLTIQFGTSQLRETDILMLALVSLWGMRVILRRDVRYGPTSRLLYLLVLVLIFPVFTGLAVGKPLTVVLRDFRTPLFFLSIFSMLDVLQTYADLRGLIRFMGVIGVFSLLVGLVWWQMNMRLGTAYRFGIESALSLNVWLLFLAIVLVSLGQGSRRLRRWAWIYIVLALVFIFFANDIRSVYGGMFGALPFLGLVLYLRRRRLVVSRSFQQRISVLFLCFMLLALLLAFAISLGLDLERGFQDLVTQDMRLAQLYSLVTPFVEAGNNFYIDSNVGNRMLGVSYGFELGIRNAGLGMGYGDNDFVDMDQTIVNALIGINDLAENPGNTVENLIFTHNSYGWALGRLGLWLALAYFTVVLLIFFQAWQALLKTNVAPLRVLLLGTLSFGIYTLLLGFGGGGFFDYTGQGLILWLVCLAVLLRGTKLAQQDLVNSAQDVVTLRR